MILSCKVANKQMAVSIAVFQLYDNESLMDTFCIALVGKDLYPSELHKLACGMLLLFFFFFTTSYCISVCKKFNDILYSPRFLKQVFSVIATFKEPIRIIMNKEWRYFMWKKV